MDAEIQNKKIELIQWLSTLDDELIIEKIMKLRKKEKTDWWNEVSKEEKASVQKGIEDADSGNLESQSEARKLYEKWL
ncbi:hypothetical protein VS868_12990 [Salinimicrobium sp. 3283s]|uniref:hypothetical protein n=1 Tax=Salinimicrobium sp. 3283s TaxID=3114359 RepID=UPI0031EC31CC